MPAIYEYIDRRNTSLTMAQLTVFLFMSLALTSVALANFIQPGKVPTPPPGPKPAPTSYTESYSYTPPGAKKAIPFTITVTPGESAEDKADAIVTAIEAIKGSASKDNNTKHPEEINVGGTIALVKSTSGEADTIFALGPAGPGAFVAIAFGGVLTGATPGDGAAATYEAAFGFDGLSVQSSFSYNDLLTKSIDGLLTATYDNILADLPVSLQSNLSLDLFTGTIRFDLPNFANNPFVAGDSSDQSIFYAETLITVPEPSILFLLGMGVFCALVSTRQRRRKRHIEGHLALFHGGTDPRLP